MKIRHQLFILFLVPGISATLIISPMLFVQGKKSKLPETYTTIEATTPIKAAEWKIPSATDKKVDYENIFIPQNFLIVFNLLFIVTSFISAYIIGKRMGKPLNELQKFTAKINAGNLKSRLTNFPTNELGDLANSFNHMAEMLEENIIKMEKVGHVLSHDLRAPLNTIIPLVNFLREDNQGRLNQESEKMLSMIESKAKQMNELILEIANNTGVKKAKENIPLYGLVNTIVNDIAPPSNIQIFIQQNLPVITYSKTSLIQIYQHLLQNAIQRLNNMPGKIEIGYSNEGREHKFWVSDSSPEIPQKELESIEPSFTKDPNSEKLRSTAAWLKTIKNIVEENQGKIWIEWKSDMGSTFYFTIAKHDL